jgi:hypothetical protein
VPQQSKLRTAILHRRECNPSIHSIHPSQRDLVSPEWKREHQERIQIIKQASDLPVSTESSRWHGRVLGNRMMTVSELEGRYKRKRYGKILEMYGFDDAWTWGLLRIYPAI